MTQPDDAVRRIRWTEAFPFTRIFLATRCATAILPMLLCFVALVLAYSGGRLLDGTTFQLGLVTAHQARTKTKRSASGKTKTKRKTKQSMRARLRLQVKPGRYPGLATLLQQAGPNGVARMADDIRLPAPARTAGFDVTADALDLSARLGAGAADAAPAHHVAAMMFLGLYRVLNFVRAQDRSQQPGGDA